MILFSLLFSETKMREYMANEPALKPFMSGGDDFYRLVNRICIDLVMHRILILLKIPITEVANTMQQQI